MFSLVFIWWVKWVQFFIQVVSRYWIIYYKLLSEVQPYCQKCLSPQCVSDQRELGGHSHNYIGDPRTTLCLSLLNDQQPLCLSMMKKVT